MKKTLLVAALSGAFTTYAHAQSSVTLYGLIDAGLTYVSNERIGTTGTTGHSNFAITDGSINRSRWGLRGSEDLGGGLRTIFTLENGFTINNGALGQNSRIFGRQAFVGLSSNQLGTVTLGRQYESTVDDLAPLSGVSSTMGSTFFAHPYDNDNLNNIMRMNNSVKYQSSNYNGLQVEGLYGFSNQAGGFSNNRAYSFGATYGYGPLKFAASYLQLNNGDAYTFNPAVSAGNAGGATGAGTDTQFTSSMQRTFGAGSNYSFGPGTVGFVFTETKLQNATSINNTGSSAISLGAGGTNLRFDNYEINARYNLTPAMALIGSYTFTDGKTGVRGATSPKWNQVNLLADYLLSKRTDVYLEGQFQTLSGGGNVFTADINGLSPSANNRQLAVTAGVRTRF